MQVSVTFKHLDPTDAIRSYAEEKVKKINKYVDNAIEANVVLSVQKFRHTAEVNLMANGVPVSGTESTEDMYSSIDKVMDKIEKQLRRYKDKIKKHKPRNEPAVASFDEAIYAAESFEGESEPDVIKMENYQVKPMSVDEAVMQIDLLHQDFLVFTNASNGKVSVIYSRKDGNYGLIEPKAS